MKEKTLYTWNVDGRRRRRMEERYMAGDFLGMTARTTELYSGQIHAIHRPSVDEITSCS